MLAAGAASHEIILEYTRGIEEGYYRGLTPASGARVAVNGRRSVEFEEDTLRPGVYRGAFTPEPGERYTLRIEGPAGEVATSETRIPGIPRITVPHQDTTVTPGTDVAVRWSSVAAAGYTLVRSAPNRQTSVGSLRHVSFVRDTALVMQFGVFGGTAFDLRIVAVDENFIHYTGDGSQEESRSRNRVRSTVDGAYGLFGSYGMSDVRRISLQ